MSAVEPAGAPTQWLHSCICPQLLGTLLGADQHPGGLQQKELLVAQRGGVSLPNKYVALSVQRGQAYLPELMVTGAPQPHLLGLLSSRAACTAAHSAESTQDLPALSS